MAVWSAKNGCQWMAWVVLPTALLLQPTGTDVPHLQATTGTDKVMLLWLMMEAEEAEEAEVTEEAEVKEELTAQAEVVEEEEELTAQAEAAEEEEEDQAKEAWMV